jgi:DNA-binding MarR family transcriptional regulator
VANISSLLSDLVVVGQRLTRLAAAETGERTSPLAFLTLATLTDHGSLRTGELAVHGRVAQPAMTRVLTALTEQGWVRRVTDGDARASRFEITEEGIVMQREWHRRLGAALEPYFRDLSADDLAAVTRTVAIVNAQLDRQVT